MQYVRKNWTDLKDLVDNRSLRYQYVESDNLYEIFCIEKSITWHSSIVKDGNADQTDWENNYKANGNKKIIESNTLDGMLFGRTTVGTAGTAVILTTATKTDTVTIKALSTNTGNVYVGDNTVSSTNGFPLASSESISIDLDHNVSNLYIDADNNGEGVAWIAGKVS